MSVLEIIPLELIALIIRFSKDNRRTLYNLCLVSKDFLPEAQRWLYRRVGFRGIRVMGNERNGWVACAGIKHDNLSLFLDIISSHHNPQLALHVRDFSYRPDARERDSKFWELFTRALNLMVNLKYLRLTLLTGDPPLFRTKILCDHPFRLKVFSWKDYRGVIRDEDVDPLKEFIEDQTELESLDILSRISVFVPPSACPKLTTFIGNFALSLDVLQNRNVTNLVWISTRGTGRSSGTGVGQGGIEETAVAVHSTPSLGETIGVELEKLRVLVLMDQIPAGFDLEDLACCLKNLEVLHISLCRDTKLTEAALKKMTELLDHLPKMPKLRRLVWSGAPPLGIHDITLQRNRTFGGSVPKYFQLNQRLEEIYFSRMIYFTRGSVEWEIERNKSQSRYLKWRREFEDCPVEVGEEDALDCYQSMGMDSTLLDRSLIYGL